MTSRVFWRCQRLKLLTLHMPMSLPRGRAFHRRALVWEMEALSQYVYLGFWQVERWEFGANGVSVGSHADEPRAEGAMGKRPCEESSLRNFGLGKRNGPPTYKPKEKFM